MLSGCYKRPQKRTKQPTKHIANGSIKLNGVVDVEKRYSSNTTGMNWLGKALFCCTSCHHINFVVLWLEILRGTL